MTDLSLHHRVLPAGEGTAPHPALLLLHGRGADESDLLPLGPEIDGRLFTIGARGPLRFPWGGHAWYDLDPRGIGFPEEQSLGSSLNLLREFLGQIVDTYPIDPARLYVGGFSMGSVLAGTLALTEPDRVAGALVLSGYLPLHNNLPLRPQDAAGHPFFQAHGTHDAVIPVSFGREARDYLASTPVHLTYREYPMEHEISGQEMRDIRAWMQAILSSTSQPQED